ncbi:MAG: hypothetical protein Q8L87_06300 [Anaerolineales bacterium]|nr:hypothetical protein [Anaerolineales bacterium]
MLPKLDIILNIQFEERSNGRLRLAQYFFMGAAMLFARFFHHCDLSENLRTHHLLPLAVADGAFRRRR